MADKTTEKLDPMKVTDIIKEAGVSDLPFAVKSRFAQALLAERQGDNAKAADKLDEAVAMEQKTA